MKKPITLSDLAKLANVSMNTVSRVLNGKNGISESTKKRILALAQEYNYRPNISARTMRGLESPLIGVVVSDMEDPFFIRLISGIEERAWKEGMSIIIGNANENARKQQLCIDNHLSYGCRNMIIMPVNDDKAPMEDLIRKNIRLVLADRPVKDADAFNQVTINNAKGAFDACRYLIEKGHRKIAIINQKSEVITETDRTLGYMDALKSRGIQAEPDYIRHVADAEEAANAAIGLMRSDHPPTALFIAKDRLALSVVRALNEIGVSVPDDLSVIIYGKPDWAQTIRPYFTCMDRPIKQIGLTAADVIIEMIQKGSDFETRKIYYDAFILERDSVKVQI